MTLPILSCGLKAGDAFGHFQVERLVGRGSFGYVLAARDLRDSCEVAMKVVPCDQLDVAAARAAKEVAVAEAALLQRLRHPSIVTCYETSWDAGRAAVWMALEYMEGGDIQSVLAQRLSARAGPLGGNFVRPVLAAIASALRFIHQEGLLHRDVKPGNLLLARRGLLDPSPTQIKLADFGVAIPLEGALNAKTTGTPHYMSPEMVCGRLYGPASDAWALGVCLYEMASFRRPFEANNQLALAKQIVEEGEEPLPQGCPEDLRSVISQLLKKDVEERLGLAEALRFSPEIRRAAAAVKPVEVEELDSAKNSPRSIVSSLPDIPSSVPNFHLDSKSPSGGTSWWRGRKQSMTSPKSGASGAWCLPDNHATPQKDKRGGGIRSSWFSLFRRGTKIAEEPSIDGDTLESTTVVSTFSHTEESFHDDKSEITKRPSLKTLRAWS